MNTAIAAICLIEPMKDVAWQTRASHPLRRHPLRRALPRRALLRSARATEAPSQCASQPTCKAP